MGFKDVMVKHFKETGMSDEGVKKMGELIDKEFHSAVKEESSRLQNERQEAASEGNAKIGEMVAKHNIRNR